MGVALTVFFGDPFYVGLFERVEDGRLTVARVVFGAEPSDREVYDWMLAHYFQIRFSPAVEGARETPIASNPKRRQRQAADAQAKGIGTRSQQAIQLAREADKHARTVRTREQREADEARKRQIRVERKKARHRGR